MKKLFVCIVFTTSWFVAITQEKNAYDYWLESYNKGMGFYNANDYTSAIPHFQEALKYIELIDFSTDDTTITYPVENYYNLAMSYFKTEDYKTSAALLEQVLGLVNNNEKLKYTYREAIWEDLGYAYSNIDLQIALNYRIDLVNSLEESYGKEHLIYAQNLFVLAFNYKHLGDKDNFIKHLIEVETLLKKLNDTSSNFYAYSCYYLGYDFYNQKNFKNAKKYLDKAEQLKSLLDNDEDVDLDLMKAQIVISEYHLNNFDKVIKLTPAILELKKYQTADHFVLYQVLANNYAISLEKKGKYNEGLAILKDVSQKLQNFSKIDYEVQARHENDLANYYMSVEDYKNAINHFKKSKASYEDMNNTESIDYALTLNSIGLYYYNTGDYKNALDNYLKSISIIEKLEENLFNINNLLNLKNNLALVHLSLGAFGKAKDIQQTVLVENEKMFGINSSEYALAQMNYGNVLTEIGDYFGAEKYFNQALKIFEKDATTNWQLYATQLANLGRFYITTRQRKKALEAYEEAIGIYKNRTSQPTLGLGVALAGKGLVLQGLGQNQEALEFTKKGLDVLKESVGETHMEYGTIAQNLGLVYHNNFEYEKALECYDIAFKSFQASLKNGHKAYGQLLTNYVEVFVAIKKYDEAYKYLDIVLQNFEVNFGKESFPYNTAKLQMANAYLSDQKYEEALIIYEEIEKPLLETIGGNSDAYSNFLFNYALCNEILGNNKKAVLIYQQFNESVLKQLKDVFTYRSESEKRAFINNFSISNQWFNNFSLNPKFANDSLFDISLNNHYLLKGLLLNSTKDLFAELSKLNEPETNSKISQYRLLNNKLTKTTSINNSKNNSLTKELKQSINNLEVELVKIYSEKFTNSNLNFDKDWKTIKSNLKEREVAVEFDTYKIRVDNLLTEEIKYAAYIIHKDWEKPKVIGLSGEEELKQLLKNQTPNTLYKTRGSQGNTTTDTEELYELIWSPIEPYLDGIETVYFSPTGLLNQIPFAALDTEEKPILASQYNLIQLSSTYSLTETTGKPNNDNTLFIGGVNYDYTESGNSVTSNDTPNLSMLKSVSGTRSMDSKWNYLPGTLKEITSIEGLFKNSNKTSTTLTSKKATETAFKNLSGNSPSTIHIATHGFFFENPKTAESSTLATNNQNAYKVSEDPLLRSGLIFAGANEAWTKGENPNSEDDGILTALEISNLDLSNTDLVVLSACETGLGDIDGSEGVYGLQRAFKMAGVDVIIMSLWEVPDTETAEFMKAFYSNWLGGQDIRTAFRNTQLTMSNTYKNNPEKWAAFVLFE
ncbi:MAG: CHAT domain-containing protein [Winogradskyella sp.]|uniref:CHAT domain-containing protein n=1 Tax=Winogradskyella sp. TaxID=1883156 RepID=UPI000F405D62|nr:CHAT domain-containing protein [Winogradskyella sp.]RNC86713.1 MAG: CHAT domain-containing protein [Winogradskyella sp.]